jgi:hypothetical protein
VGESRHQRAGGRQEAVGIKPRQIRIRRGKYCRGRLDRQESAPALPRQYTAGFHRLSAPAIGTEDPVSLRRTCPPDRFATIHFAGTNMPVIGLAPPGAELFCQERFNRHAQWPRGKNQFAPQGVYCRAARPFQGDLRALQEPLSRRTTMVANVLSADRNFLYC